MTSKKNDNPFNLILEEMKKGTAKNQTSALNFGNLLKQNNKRREIRTKAAGIVDLFSIDEKIITRGVLRNVSPGGLGLEIYPVILTPTTKLLIELGGSGNEFGKIKCIVSWVASIDNHPSDHKMIGLKFDVPSASFRKKMESFIQSLNSIK